MNSCLQAVLHACTAARGVCVSPAASAAFPASQLPAVACSGLLKSPETPCSCEHLEDVDHAQSAVCCPQAPASFARLPPLPAAAAQDAQPALHAVACTHELCEAICVGFMHMRKQPGQEFLFVPLRTTVTSICRC